MKKTYIIPATEVVEIKVCQLVMASKLDVLSGELEKEEDFLSRGTKGDMWDDEEDEEDYY